MKRDEFTHLIEQGPAAFVSWLEKNPTVYTTDDSIPLWRIAMEMNIPQLTVALIDRAISDNTMNYQAALGLLTPDEQYIFLSFLFSIGDPENLSQALDAGFSADSLSPEMQIPVYKTLINQVISETVRKPLLHSVLTSLNLPMIDLLASKVKDINAKDTLGNTALHDGSVILAATEDGTFPIVELLLLHKADRNIRNNDDLTPLGYLDKMLPMYADKSIIDSSTIQKLRKTLEDEPRIILLS